MVIDIDKSVSYHMQTQKISHYLCMCQAYQSNLRDVPPLPKIPIFCNTHISPFLQHQSSTIMTSSVRGVHILHISPSSHIRRAVGWQKEMIGQIFLSIPVARPDHQGIPTNHAKEMTNIVLVDFSGHWTG